MKHEPPSVLVHCRCMVGEGPLYDESGQTLYWVDIPRGRLWRHRLCGGNTDFCQVGEPAGSLCLAADGGYVIATRQGFVRMQHWGTEPHLWRPLSPWTATVRSPDWSTD
ncbi:MAG: hypothetical protein HOV67_31040 [Kribbellaceae bacterium]|nr:hypothetical protein [Kribbellaceae bacterium]